MRRSPDAPVSPSPDALGFRTALVLTSCVALVAFALWWTFFPSPATGPRVTQPVPDAAPDRDPQAPSPPGRAEVAQPPQRSISGEQFSRAAGTGEITTVHMGLRQGIDPDIADADGQTPLMLAGFNGHLSVMRLLIDKGADVNHTSSLNRTPLMVTASGPNPEAVRLLLHEGADVNVRDSHEGWTALMIAATEGHADIVAMLLEAGADPTLVDADGDTAMSFAEAGGHAEVMQVLSQQPHAGKAPSPALEP